MGVVAGTITTAFQDVASHVNIKAKQRHTPNLMLRSPTEIAKLKALDGKAIHLTVRAGGYHFEESTVEVVRTTLESVMSTKKWTTPTANFGPKMVTFDRMCSKRQPLSCLQQGARLGGKAAGLGFLAHRAVIGMGSSMQKKMGYRLTPLGFAIPIAAYREFVDFNSARDPRFAATLKRLTDSELSTTPTMTSQELRKNIIEVQMMFLQAPLPTGLYRRINKQLKKLVRSYRKQFPGQTLKNVKIRSSANVEDIPNFNGAGLHNSYSAKLKRSVLGTENTPCNIVKSNEQDRTETSIEPKTLACAIKATYASLWNLRAFRERSFRRFDHRSAYMGLAIVPSYKHSRKSAQGKIAANSVVLTRVLNTSTVYGYQLSTQVGSNLVTNPQPGSLAELTMMTFQLRSTPAATILHFAQPTPKQPPLNRPLLSAKTMQEIVAVARATEEAYCRARPEYFIVEGKKRKCHEISNSTKKPSALDIELKIYDNKEILFKQVREFDER